MSWHNVAGQLTDQQVREQLLAALCQPFEEPGENHIGKWFETLEWSLPLWSFQPVAFRRINDIEAPSASPLEQIIDSILNDEAEEDRGDELVSALNDRRRHLTKGIVGVETWGLTTSRAPNVVMATDAGRYWSPHLRSTIGVFNPQYAGIGKQVTTLVDAIDAARGKTDRLAAKEQLEAYIKELTRSRRGRPTEGPSARMLEALYDEGKALFALLWGLPEFDLDTRSTTVLESQLPASTLASDLVSWSRRLVLPILSRIELRALSSGVEESRAWETDGSRPSARYFTIWVLAHRLRLNPVTLAEKVLGSRDAEYFTYKENPIDAFPAR